jgi:hypothetical protein
VWTSIPSVRLTRAGKGTTICRTQKREGRIAVSVTDLRRLRPTSIDCRYLLEWLYPDESSLHCKVLDET